MEITVLIPFWNGHQHINRLLDSIPKDIRIIIVDDHSDEPLQLNRQNVDVIRPKTKGYFTGAVNHGIRACKTDVLIMNQDTWLSGTAALDLIAEKRVTFALIGERIKGEHPAFPGHGYIHGTFMYIRRDLIRKIGRLDAKHFPLWGSTADYQLRACRAGFQALPLPTVPGFNHIRGKKKFGSAISELLSREPENKGLLVRTPPLISVVINCFNHGRYLDDAINSLIGGQTTLGHMRGQTLQAFEVIIVDDGSTDNTREIGSALANPWKGIHYYHQKNSGSAVAMNNGIKRAFGRYIAPLDADDMMSESRLESMMAVLEKNPHSVVCDNMALFRKGDYIRNPDGAIHQWKMLPYDFNTLIHKNTMHKGLLFPKVAWEEAGGYPAVMDKGREDWAFNVALGIKGWCGVYCPSTYYLYRREGQNRTLKNTTPGHRAAFSQQLYRLFPNIYVGDRPMGCCGKGAGAPAQKNNNMAASFTGRDGMTLIQYTGGNAGDMTFWSEGSERRYIFGGNRKRGYVDNRDLNHFLGMFKNGKTLFALVQAEPVKKDEPKPVKSLAPEPEKLDAAIAVADLFDDGDEEEIVELSVPDPTTMTVKEFTALLAENDYLPDELQEMLKLEEARDDTNPRVTILRAINEALSVYEPA